MKRNKFIVLMMSCIFALSVTSCSGDKNSSTIEVNTNPDTTVSDDAESKNNAGDSSDDGSSNANAQTTVAYPSLVDEDGNFVTEITVTDAAGATQTEYVIVNDSNEIVTDNDGNNIKPSAPVKPTVEVMNPTSKATALWIGSFNSNSETEDDKWFDLKEDGDFMAITFKVKDNCPEGNYKVTLNPTASSFSDEKSNSITPVYSSGTISVGNAQAETNAPSTSGTQLYITDKTAQPGETVTVNIGINNNTKGLLGFIVCFDYDSSALELVDIKPVGFISTTGDFTSSV
ncbi:MAG: hypothetical protein IJP18_07760 [Oscillospiraceae bacterium]|nr:hypothetical protein [Oscillospiraceae bacterium]